MTINDNQPPPGYLSATSKPKFANLPPHSSKASVPSLNQVVTVNNCYYYLSLIERFWRMMDKMTIDQQRLFLARAEFRYELWVHASSKKAIPVPPPLDVAYVWHTHLLSPFRFFEDMVIRNPSARKFFDTPIPLDAIHSERQSPSEETLEQWNRNFGKTGEPYVLSVRNMGDGEFHRTCLKCNTEIRLPWELYVGYRYGKNTTPFDHRCGNNGQINFLDVARIKLEYDLTVKEVHGPTVAGTLLGPKGEPRKKGNRIIPFINPIATIEPQQEMDYAYELQIEEKLKTLGQKYEYDANELLYAIRTSYQGNPSPFSLDLIHAVARQRKFYDSALSMDWSFPDGFTSAIRRYHDFLMLLKKNPTMVAVPTIEIDCAWHTHMLFAQSYRTFTLKHLKRVINHDDTIPESSLKKFASDTNKAWLKSPVNYLITKVTKSPKTLMYEATLTINKVGFGWEYYPGKIEFSEEERRRPAPALNDLLSSANHPSNKAISISAHCHDVTKSFYRDDGDINQLRDMQDFIAEGMKKTSYGYIGTVSCGTGGKGAIFSSDDRNFTGKEISSRSKNKWYQLGSNDPTKIQNRYRDLDGSKSTSQHFRDVDAPPYPLQRRRSRDDIDQHYYTGMTAGAGMFIAYPPIMYLGYGGGVGGGCGTNSAACSSGNACGSSACSGGGGGGGCGGGGGGGCGGGGGGC